MSNTGKSGEQTEKPATVETPRTKTIQHTGVKPTTPATQTLPAKPTTEK
jgi:hypothetical protein